MPPQPYYNIWIRTIDETNEFSAPYGQPGFDATIFLPNTSDPSKPHYNIPLPRGLKRIGLVKEYDSLEFKTRFNNVGGWVLKMRDDTPEASMLKRLCVGLSTDPNNQTASGKGYGGITVTRSDLTTSNQVIFSGPVRGFNATGDFYVQEGPTIEFYGTDDNVYLQDRLICPLAPSLFLGNTFTPDNVLIINPGNQPYSGGVDSGNQTVTYTDASGHQQYINYGKQSLLPGSMPQGTNMADIFRGLNRGGQGYTYFNVDNPVRATTSTCLEVFINHSVSIYAPYADVIPSRYIQPASPVGPQIPPPVYAPSGVYPNPVGSPDGLPVTYPSKIQSRRIPFLYKGKFEDSTVLSFARARFNNLLEKCQEIASIIPAGDQNTPQTYFGLSFNIQEQDRPLNNDPGTKTVLVYNIELVRGMNNTPLVFSQSLGNLGAYKYSFDTPKFNYSVIGGQGESYLRWFFGKSAESTFPFWGNSITKFGLRENFHDRRDIQYGDSTATPNSLPVDPNNVQPGQGARPINFNNYRDMRNELIDAMNSDLRENNEILSLEVSIIDGKPFRYFVDYFVGNYCQVVIGGEAVLGQITDATITLTKAEGEVVKLNIGTQATGYEYKFLEALVDNRNNLEVINIGQ